MARCNSCICMMLACMTTLSLPLAVQGMAFDQYLQQFRKSYHGPEFETRKALYEQRRAQVASLNARPGAMWKAGFNPMSDMHDVELRQHQGYNKALRRVGSSDGFDGGLLSASLRGAARMQSANSTQLPESRDWRAHSPPVITPVKNQGVCGSCWAIAAAQAIESHLAISTGELISLSPQQLTSCTPNPHKCGGGGGCGGATMNLAFNYTIQAGGLSEIWDYPYVSKVTKKTEVCYDSAGNTAAKITGYQTLPQNDAGALLEAVALVGPVAVSVDASMWFLYDYGIFDECDKNPDINHAVNIIGYGATNGTKYWLIRNSWGARWGERGYMRLRRHYGGEGSQDEPCGMDTDPGNGVGCEGETQQIRECGECGILSDASYPLGVSFGFTWDIEG